MKLKLALILSLFLIGSPGRAQDWIRLSFPQASIIGAPAGKTEAEFIQADYTLKYEKNSVTDVSESTESMQEYQDDFRKFITSYFKGSKVTLQSVTGNKLQVKTLSQETIDKLENGVKYVYEGVTAQTLTLSLCAPKEDRNGLISIMSDIVKALHSDNLLQVPAILIDTLSRSTIDSVFYRMEIYEPGVYNKVRVIRIKQNGNICNCNWETNCFSYFVNYGTGGFPRADTLIAGSETKHATILAKPVFCGKDNKGLVYQLQVVRDDKGLHLWLLTSQGNKNNAMSRKLEVPFKDVMVKGKPVREWNLGKTFLYRYMSNDVIKNIFLEVVAKQITNDKLVILNWKEGKPGYSDIKLSTLKYPEFKAVFVK